MKTPLLGLACTLALAPALAALAGLVACSSSTPGAADAGVHEGGSLLGDADLDSGGPACPADAPQQGSACGPQGLACEYGTAATVECDTVATCNGGRWEVALPTMTKSLCQTGPAADCPASFAAVPIGQHCDPYLTICEFAQGRCACTVRESPTVYDASAQATWICPSPGSGCPLPRPRLGTPCTSGDECDYGTCAIPGATAQACTDNLWVQEETACQ